MDWSPPGSSLHGISQARILEWVAISLFRRSHPQGSNPHLLHCRQILYSLSHQRSPIAVVNSAKINLLLMHGLEANLATSLQTPQEA